MPEMTSIQLLSNMRPEAARERIESFKEYFGLAHLYFAQHAAFPMALTSDLLYRLWINFQRDTSDKKLNIPWIAVADLLLSSLCEEVGYELYEMDVMIRAELLNRLKTHPSFGQKRINELSHLLLNYVQQQLHSDDPGIRDFAQVQRWTALAYTQPTQVAKEFAVALNALHKNNRVEQIRIVSLMETLNQLADPLATLEGFVPLLIYARSIGQLARDEMRSAGVRFSTPKQTEQTKRDPNPLGSDLPENKVELRVVKPYLLRPGMDERAIAREMVRDNDSEHWEAFNTFVNQTVRAKAKNIPTDTCEDIAQEVMHKVKRGLPSFRFESSLASWVNIIIERTIVDIRRRLVNDEITYVRLGHTSESDHEGEWVATSEEQSAEDVFLTNDEIRIGWAACLEYANTHANTVRDRLILQMVILEGKTYSEAARAAGSSEAVVGFVVREAQRYARKMRDQQ